MALHGTFLGVLVATREEEEKQRTTLRYVSNTFTLCGRDVSI